MNKEALKFDSNKTDLSLLPGDALAVVAQVLEFGAAKYQRNNWTKGMKWSRLVAAALRHIFAVAGGEWLDKESGLPHAAHACCCLLFLLSYSKRGLGDDDLSPEKAEEPDKTPVSPPAESPQKPTMVYSSPVCGGEDVLVVPVSPGRELQGAEYTPVCGFCYCRPCTCDQLSMARIAARRQVTRGGNDVPT